MYGRDVRRHNGLVHEVAGTCQKVIPEVAGGVDGLWIHSLREVSAPMGRLIARLIAAQDGWARPLGDFNKRWLGALFRPIRPVKDVLNGVWLGHPVHAAATDIPIGTLLLTVILDLMGQKAAADVALVATILFMLAAAVTGAADYSDTDGTALVRATLHATLMVVALLVLLVSLAIRAGGAPGRTIPTALSIIGFVIVTTGAYVGGDVVYIFGNMVSRHAFRGAGTKWVRLDTGDVTDLATLPEATPTKAKAGVNELVLVRIANTIHALHATCAHAGGPLAQGTFVDGCIECPWHGSRFRLANGHVRRGPALYDQPAYEIRAAEGGGYEVRRAAS
jgi:nitrite reductase/ring-hydroxylating ferredoxin subunit/uncharacterized membrane protein